MSVAAPPLPKRRRFSVAHLVAAIVVVAIVTLATLLPVYWPFKEAAIIRSLEEASSSQVTIAKFSESYFPHPGCTAEGVVFRRRQAPAGTPPLISIRWLKMQGSFFGLLTKHLARIHADGMSIFIPAQDNEKFRSSSDVTIDELKSTNATLQFAPRDKTKKPSKFVIYECTLRDLGGFRAAVPFHARLDIPEPPAQITTSGKFGPWKHGNAGQIPVSGTYQLENANLGVFSGISGTLSSTGNFEGTLDRISIQGKADVPNFTVSDSSHHVDLKNDFKAFVNAKTGDISLESVESHFWRTTVWSHGTIARQGPKKTRVTDIEMQAQNGRIEDVLDLFISADKAPMTGVSNMRAHVTIAPPLHPFLRIVKLQGDFGVDAAQFTKSDTQKDVNKLSAEARSENDQDPSRVLSNLKGHADLTDGTATFTDLSFSIPGAHTTMHGTYNLISERIDLHGTLAMDSSLSHTAHGPKALLLKFMQPFFKRKRGGSKVPVKITGTYDKPAFGLDLGGQKENAASKRLERAYHKPTK
ncbi:MAG TPA: AsmA-like C-terminal region-containing protein [Terriglobales bacterium]|nr:AsmA-like C-terminal region-containing protein [Terriglobales bacterium]